MKTTEKTDSEKPDQKGLSEQMKKLRTKVVLFREELNGLDAEKEKWYEKKEGYSKQILEIIRKVKDAKRKRNSLTDEVKVEKKLRTDLNSKIKDKIGEIKKLHTERDEIAKKKKISIDPGRIKREISKLETKVETSVMPFDQEQKIMKLIRNMKKELNEAKELLEVSDKISAVSKDIDVLKKEAEDVHQGIQSKASASQEEHEHMFEHSKAVDELRKGEEEAYKQFMEFKKKFSDVNNKLKAELSELNKISYEMDSVKMTIKKARKKLDEKKLEHKMEHVDDKIKKRQKLTTEDLLVFQKTAESE